MQNLSGYGTRSDKWVELPSGTPFYEHTGDVTPLKAFAKAVTVNVLARAKEPADWYLVRISTGYGWPDGQQRTSGVYVHVPAISFVVPVGTEDPNV
jgi:hypothetical protein